MIRQAAKRLFAAMLMGVAAVAGPSATPSAVAATATAVSVPVTGTTPGAAVPSVVDARVLGDKDRTRFILDLTANVQPVVFPLADPYRLVIDLTEVRFQLPATVGQSGRGLVTAFRYGLFSPGKSRVVVDLSGPVKIDKTYVTEMTADQPARLVVEMVPSTRSQFLSAAAVYRDAATAAAAARAGGQIDLAPSASTKRVVVIDPGHGGIDLGAISKGGLQEKSVALAFAKALADRLTATGRYDVYMTRNDDSFVSLGDRVAFARNHHADLLLSIHANSYSSSSVRGAAVYTLCEQVCDADASRMAMSENQSDALAGIDVAAPDSSEVRSILTDLTRRETMNFAQVFAINLVKEFKSSETGLFKEPHQEANFKVLRAADVPSALIELGFITNASDEKLMNSPDWQATTAAAMVKAVTGYFAARLASEPGNAEIVAQKPR